MSTFGLFAGREDFVEHAPVIEMLLLGLLPTPEKFVDSEQLQLREAIRILRGYCFESRTIVILCSDFLPFFEAGGHPQPQAFDGHG